jgi:hypothetical protein
MKLARLFATGQSSCFWPEYRLLAKLPAACLWPGYLAPAKLPAAGQQTYTEGKITSSGQGCLMAKIFAAGHVNN